MKKIRITRGKYLSSGKTFKIIDDWSVRANAHRMLDSAWLGTTDFRETSEYIDDDSDEEKEDGSAEAPRLVERESPSGCTSTEPNKEELQETELRESRTQYFELSPSKSVTSDAQSDLLVARPKGSEEESRRQLAPKCEQGQLDAQNPFDGASSLPWNSGAAAQSPRGSARETPTAHSFAPLPVIHNDRQGQRDQIQIDARGASHRSPPAPNSIKLSGQRVRCAPVPPILAIDQLAVHGSGAWLIL